MKCLILAAGKGTRIASAGDVKPLVPLAGLPLIERTIVGAQRAGVTDFCVITGHHAERLEAFLCELGQRRNLSITTLSNDQWERGNGTSVLRARDLLSENFVLLMADHVFDESILSRLIRETPNDSEIILVADYQVRDNPRVDVNDVTKVLIEDDRIVAIGKDIENYNAYDTGIFLCSPAIFPAAAESLRDGDGTLTGAVRLLAEKYNARALDVAGGYWLDVDTPDDLKQAASMLYDGLIKPHDGFIARSINRKFSLRVFTPLLLKVSTRITANQVTVLSFLVALGAGACFFLRHALIGGLLIQLASILDGCDGEIARLKKLQSDYGNFLDAVLDRYADTFLLFGMSYYAWAAAGDLESWGQYAATVVLATSILAIVGNLMVSYTSAMSVSALGYRYRGGWIAAGKGRDVRLFVLFIGGVLAWIDPAFVFLALLIVAALTNAIVLRRIGISRRYAQAPNPLMDISLKAVIFDFDGTLADTMPFLTDLGVSLITENYQMPADEAHRCYRQTTGMDFASQLEQIFPGHERNTEVAATFERKKRERIMDHPIFPEVNPTLALFKNRNVKRFICSSTKAGILTEYARKTGLADRVDGCFGHEPGFGKKAQIDSILRRHKLAPDEVLFVGDSLGDYDFVRDSQVRFIGICRLFDARDFRQRGLFSVPDLTALTYLWQRSGDVLQFVNKEG